MNDTIGQNPIDGRQGVFNGAALVLGFLPGTLACGSVADLML